MTTLLPTETAIPIRLIALRGENYLHVQNVTTVSAAEVLNTRRLTFPMGEVYEYSSHLMSH